MNTFARHTNILQLEKKKNFEAMKFPTKKSPKFCYSKITLFYSICNSKIVLRKIKNTVTIRYFH